MSAVPAYASKPDVEHLTSPSVYTLSPSDTGCAFSIDVSGVDKVVIQTFFDKQGNPIKVVFHDDFTGTETANGVTLNSIEHANITEDLVTGTETWTGLPLQVSLPHGGVITKDAGKLVYNPDGSIAVEHGPHPYADGDVAAYCGAFTP
jgi:hypothetical protein